MKKLFRNLAIINSIRASEDYRYFKYGFNFLIMRRNVSEIFEFTRRVFEEWGGSSIEMHHVGGVPNELVTTSKEHSNIYNLEIEKVKKNFGEKNITFPDKINIEEIKCI